jgi:hypothetical protein
MKNVVLFFLFLCVHLVGGYHYAHASARNEKVSLSPARDQEKTHQVESATTNHDYLIIANTSLSGENPNLISIEDEDENEDIIKKHVSEARYLLAFCYAFILNSHFSFLAEPLPSCNHLSYTSSCKYIVQRALRI